MIKKLFSFLLFALLVNGTVLAQSMSDEQVIEYVKTASTAGKSQKQIMTELAAKGVTRAQAERIKKRYEKMQAEKSGMGAVEKNRMRENVNLSNVISDTDTTYFDPSISDSTQHGMGEPEKIVFGRNIFNNKNLTFEPSQNLATPANYKLGPGDEVIIDIWGNNQNTIREFISPDGNINIESIGLVYLNGMTIKEAENYLKKELSKIYSISSTNDESGSKIKLSLGQIRTIQINVMGEVNLPGTYALSSFSTIFHALYRAGGVNELGSLRNIYLARNGKTIANVDIYEFILKGKTMSDIRLQEGDVVIVPPYELLVEIQGNVKRPMFYEMKNGETVNGLI